ncbi:LysR family transcriptional regulator [Benzoatithermus flavus]|uniref:LysR family transcriptional regulator n=1 Tax=Benzoatithermus flavus TaxID=3108223 RepID=A0ABU8XXP7_9PROT
MTRAARPFTMPEPEWLRTFEAAAQRESFTAAARDLGLTQAAVSQHIRKLEASLGRPLFRRLPRGVELTADGAAYLPHVHEAFAALARSTHDLFAVERGRAVKLAAPASIATLWLAPRLPRLVAAHPRINLTIAAIHRPADYDAEKAALEIRFGDGAWPDREARHLLPESLTPVCAPALLRTAPEGDWTRLPLLGLAGAREGWSEWFAAEGMPAPAAPRLRFDTLVTALAAAKAGAGVLLASLPLAEAELASGALVRLSPRELRTASGHWLARIRRAATGSDVESVWRWLLDEASRTSIRPS